MSNFEEVFAEDELIDSYLNYAMSVIIGRALPDVRDGLKPVHRRTLFVMKELNNRFNRSYKKSARIVGDVIGKYHPHGEMAVYDSIVRLSQSFVQRYPLIDGQGNFGSVDGDAPAAMRYTEVRLSEFSEYLLCDLDFFTVDYIANYDNTEKQPVVLPTIIPNLLVNGSYGIAVGMATNIPPHNLIEIIDACLVFLDNPNITIDFLMNYVIGPDFPTYGNIFGFDDIVEAYVVGRGKICVKSEFSIEYEDDDKAFIIIKELPYQVNKLKLIDKINDLIKQKKIDVRFVRDESDKDGLRIFIDVLKGKDPNVVMNYLFSFTKLQSIFNFNMVALVDNLPKLLNLRDMIRYFVDHRKEVVYRKTKYNLFKFKERVHILEGLSIVLLNINVIIDLINKSQDFNDLKLKLLTLSWKIDDIKTVVLTDLMYSSSGLYTLSKMQVQAILDLKLVKLLKLERDSIISDYVKLSKEVVYYESVLNNDELVVEIIKNELLFIKEKFGDSRRTRFVNDSKKLIFKDFISKENIIIILSKNGYIKSQLFQQYRSQHRGGKGKSSAVIKHDDFIQDLVVTDTHSILLCFSNFGKVYWINLDTVPLSSRHSNGVPIINLLNLKKGEKINVIFSNKSFEMFDYVFMVTKKGFVKKVSFNEFKKHRSNGLIAIDLCDDDFLVDVKLIKSSCEIMLFTSAGRSIRFFSKDVRCLSRTAKGSIGIRLNVGDNVISLVVLDKNVDILVATANGYGKRSNIDEYPITKRGGKGVIGIRIDKKSGYVVKVEKIFESDEVFLITTRGMITRIKVKEIPCTGRKTRGVFLINLSGNEFLVSIKRI